MLSQDDVRRLALALPEAVEQDHHGMPSFRVNKKVFATLRTATPKVMLVFDPEDQHHLLEGRPDALERVPGTWGLRGCTLISYEKVDEAQLAAMMHMAWARLAPKRLAKAFVQGA